MPRPRTHKKPFYARLTEAEIQCLDEEKARQGVKFLSVVFEAALLELLDDPDLERNGLRLPPAITGTVTRSYRASPETLRRLDDTATRLGFSAQDIMRAAVGRLRSKRADQQRYQAAILRSDP